MCDFNHPATWGMTFGITRWRQRRCLRHFFGDVRGQRVLRHGLTTGRGVVSVVKQEVSFVLVVWDGNGNNDAFEHST